ncbi:MAG: hypothetical protein ABI863_10290 [Ginsengibacter sp.]
MRTLYIALPDDIIKPQRNYKVEIAGYINYNIANIIHREIVPELINCKV